MGQIRTQSIELVSTLWEDRQVQKSFHVAKSRTFFFIVSRLVSSRLSLKNLCCVHVFSESLSLSVLDFVSVHSSRFHMLSMISTIDRIDVYRILSNKRPVIPYSITRVITHIKTHFSHYLLLNVYHHSTSGLDWPLRGQTGEIGWTTQYCQM